MSNDTEGARLLTESDAKVAAIHDLMPRLLVLQSRLRAAGLEAVAVTLPAAFDPGRYEGDDATDYEATLMGLPIVWGKTIGLVVPA